MSSASSGSKEDHDDGGDQNARYTDNLVRRNPGLIEYSAELHQKNLIPVGTYVLDLDAHVRNAASMIHEAKNRGVKLYYMTKQINRNPLVAHAVLNTGFEGAVAVEPQELRSLVRYGVKIGHAGHLVNVPESEIDFVLKVARPQVITVFNIEKAKMISGRAAKLGIKQDLLVRPMNARDVSYPYMEGGVAEADAVKLIKDIDALPNVRVAGITSFPCMLYDVKAKRPTFTPNIDTLMRVAHEAEKNGLELTQINTPPCCITKTIPLYAEKGSTHLEPGLGVSGMAAWHCMEPDVHPEVPAGVYVTEISHFVDQYAYVYGGGFNYIEIFEMAYDGESYIPSQSTLKMKALVGRTPKGVFENQVDAEHFHGIIDYHAKLWSNPSVRVGDTVVYGFRTQMFVTRGQVAVVSGLSENNPRLVGLFDHANNLIDRFGHTMGEEKTHELIRKFT